MPLQSNTLTMVALEVKSDSPPNKFQPTLTDGIHLRWAFRRDLGFPFFGFYLFRREHIGGDPVCLRYELNINSTNGFRPGLTSDNSISFQSFGTVSSDNYINLVNFFDPDNILEVDLNFGNYLRFSLPTAAVTFQIIVTLGFTERGTINITGLSSNTRGQEEEIIPVVEVKVSGTEKEIVRRTLYFDLLTGVRIEKGPAVVIDICYVPINSVTTGNWEAISGLEQPICLPIQHPDYPGREDPEAFSATRAIADDRITYFNGYHRKYTSLPATSVIIKQGLARVTSGSKIIINSLDDWSESIVGLSIEFENNPVDTVYTIQQVLAPNKLLLSRNYQGNTATQENYTLRDDKYAQLYDTLAYLVEGGVQGEPMASKVVPGAIYESGTVDVAANEQRVVGINTAWTAELAGMDFQVIKARGNASAEQGSCFIENSSPGWNNNLVGCFITTSSSKERYIIINVQSGESIKLDRPFQGITGAITYEIFEKAIYSISTIPNQNLLQIDRPYRGESQQGLSYRIFSKSGRKESTGNTPPAHLHSQYPLDLVLMASLHPDYAQSLGLYWIDKIPENEAGRHYDYLIVADYQDTFNGLEIEAVTKHINTNSDYNDLEGFIVFHKTISAPKVLEPPSDLQAFSINSNFDLSWEGADVPHLRFSAGLSWDFAELMTPQGTILPDKPLFYHVLRAVNSQDSRDASILTLEQDTPPRPRSPILASRHTTHPLQRPNESQTPPGWPNAPIFFIDQHLEAGNYTYWLVGMDIFGRHSDFSNPANIQLADQLPPPMPPGVEAWALDPLDSYVLEDEAYNRWKAELADTSWHQALSTSEQNNLLGLRVKWGWTFRQMRQAPDVASFTIYFNPDRYDLGEDDASVAQIWERRLYTVDYNSSHQEVIVRNPNIHTLEGEAAFINAYSFHYEGDGDLRDPQLTGARIVFKSDNSQGRKFYTIAAVDPATGNIHVDEPLEFNDTSDCQILNIYLEGQAASLQDLNRVLLDGYHDLGNPNLIGEPIFFENDTQRFDKTYIILATNNTAGELLLDGTPSLNGPSSWVVGTLTRVYEVFFPFPSDDPQIRIPLATNYQIPIAYAQVGVSAVDHASHIGPVGGPATILRVHRTPPPRPTLPPIFEAERLYATPADYHGKSFFTARWLPLLGPTDNIEPVHCHIYRALDDTLFSVDWTWRKANSSSGLGEVDTVVFPAEFLGTEPDRVARRAAVREEVEGLKGRIQEISNANELRTIYESLSPDTLRVLAGLKHTEGAFTQLTIRPLSPTNEAHYDFRGPDDAEDYIPSASLRAYQDTLDGKSRNSYFYRYGYVDEAHNRSGDMSIATPPVVLVDVIPPPKPKITKVIPGDNKITIRWIAQPSLGHLHFSIFRSESKAFGRDIRLMEFIEQISVHNVPHNGSTLVKWEDLSIGVFKLYYYRIVGINILGIQSAPSNLISARAFSLPPSVPNFQEPLRVIRNGNEFVILEWHHTTESGLRSLIEKRFPGSDIWIPVTKGWLPAGVESFEYRPDLQGQAWEYRLLVVNHAGQHSSGYTNAFLPK